MMDQSVVVIPTYNEALNVQPMIEMLFKLYPELSILIIDDNSPDKTASVVIALKNIYPKLFLIKREGKLGLGTAYVEGFHWALLKKFKYIFQMDCDFSHDPQDLKRLIDELKAKNADLAIGSRYSDNGIRTKDWALHRLLLSYTAAFFLRLLTGLKTKDILGGFKCFKRETLEKIELKKIISKGYVFQFEMNFKVQNAHLKIIEVPIVFSERVMGVSKMHVGIVWEAVKVFIILKFGK